MCGEGLSERMLGSWGGGGYEEKRRMREKKRSRGERQHHHSVARLNITNEISSKSRNTPVGLLAVKDLLESLHMVGKFLNKFGIAGQAGEGKDI